MKKKFFLAIFSILTIQLHAEIRRGVVLDANTRQPIPRASVYISGSTIGTACNDEGVFYLDRFPRPPYRIHISAVGFETAFFDVPESSEYNSVTILLRPRVLELAEVVIRTPVKDGWEQFGQQFFEDFIGFSDFARQCRILNPEVLVFFFDETELVLRVYAEKPLIIINNALGYRITYWLDKFERNFKTGTLFFKGTSLFEDLITPRTRRNRAQRWQNNRISAYNGSIYHFIASLYHNRTEEEGFEVRPLRRVTEEQAFENAPKEIDTLQFNEEIWQKLEAFFVEKQSSPARLLINKQDIAERHVQNLKIWYHDTANFSTARFRFFSSLNEIGQHPPLFDIVEFRKDLDNPKQIIRSQFVSDTALIIDKDNTIVQRRLSVSRTAFELLFGIIDPYTLVQTHPDGRRTLSFENHLQVVYKYEAEEEAYWENVARWRGQPSVNLFQTSLISLHHVDEVTIFPDGHFYPRFGLLLEQYWSFEKLDKLLPLDFIPPTPVDR